MVACAVPGFSPSPSPQVHQPRSFHACERCHRRKKKCDKALPTCISCKKAKTKCAYSKHTLSTYPIEYVQSLEQKIARLRSQLNTLTVNKDNTQSDVELTPEISNNIGSREEKRANENEDENEDGNQFVGGLVTDFGVLSLSAAEGHYLGPASGISFARLTQSVIHKVGFKEEYLLHSGYMLSSSETNLIDEENDDDNNPLPMHMPNSESSHNPSTPRSDPVASNKHETAISLPISAQRAEELVSFYWKHSHTLYPFIQRKTFTNNLNLMFKHQNSVEKSPNDPPNPDEEKQLSNLMSSPVWLFQLYMVLAIGSTSMASVTITSEDEATGLYIKALNYFDEVLSRGNLIALEALLLSVSFSFFNRLGSDTWYLVGLASRMAIGMGLHTERSVERLPPEQQESRRRMFWSLYMMDRVVSTTLGRPLAIRDQDLDVHPFTTIDTDRLDLFGLGSGSYLEVTRHILTLRTIAGQILERFYSIRSGVITDEQRHEILESFHEELIIWRRTMPFPLVHSSLIPHLTTSWFDLNYYNLVIMLYRPSPLWPDPPTENLKIMTDASAMALQQFISMSQQRTLAFNWLNLLSVFTATLVLIFITTKPNWSQTYIDEAELIKDLKLAEVLLCTFIPKFGPAKSCVRVVRRIIRRLNQPNYTKQLRSASTSPQNNFELSQSSVFNGDETMSIDNSASNLFYPQLQNQVAGFDNLDADTLMTSFMKSPEGYVEDMLLQLDPMFMSQLNTLPSDETALSDNIMRDHEQGGEKEKLNQTTHNHNTTNEKGVCINENILERLRRQDKLQGTIFKGN